MPEFSYDMALPCKLDGGTDDAYANVVRSIQDLVASHASSHQALVNEIKTMTAHNQHLRETQRQLMQEKTQLLAQLQPGRDATSRINTGASQRSSPEESSQMFEFVRSYKYHDQPVHSVSMNLDMDVFATASWDGKVHLVSLKSEDIITTLHEGHNGPMSGLYSVAFNKVADARTNTIIGCSSCDKAVYLWDYEKQEQKIKLSGHTDEVNCIDFHETQFVMASASDDKKCIIWDYHEGLELRKLDKHTKQVYGARFLGVENQYMVATCSFDKTTRIFDMRNKKVSMEYRNHADDIIGIDYTSKRQLLATGSDDGLISVYDNSKATLAYQINTRRGKDLKENEVKRVAFSPGGDFLAAGTSSNVVLVYDLRSSQASLCATLTGHTDCVFDVTWGRDPTTGALVVVSASHDHTCQSWREIK